MPRQAEAGSGVLAANVMHFARVLRAAGVAVGPGRVVEAIAAVEAVGVHRRDDFYWALHASLISRSTDRPLFDQAFALFWRDPDLLKRAMSLILPSISPPGVEPQTTQASRRVAEAMLPGANTGGELEQETMELDAALTYSDRELLREKDFEEMSAEEIAEATQAIHRLNLPIENIRTRRFRPSVSGARLDMRATLRASLLHGGAGQLCYKRPRLQHPPLVLLCDISGSMSRYSRMVLHLMHAMTSDRDRVHGFVFGTRLTNVTRYLRGRDVDEAMARISDTVDDWDGGTRIGHCLREFNRRWSRRVLAQGAVVILISDGLDRDAAAGIAPQIERLHKSCRRLIWVNPLLRYDGFEPKSVGVRAILPHVDEFRPVHNIDSLTALAAALDKPQRGFGVQQYRVAGTL